MPAFGLRLSPDGVWQIHALIESTDHYWRGWPIERFSQTFRHLDLAPEPQGWPNEGGSWRLSSANSHNQA
jgi:hypothetical protein